MQTMTGALARLAMVATVLQTGGCLSARQSWPIPADVTFEARGQGVVFTTPVGEWSCDSWKTKDEERWGLRLFGPVSKQSPHSQVVCSMTVINATDKEVSKHGSTAAELCAWAIDERREWNRAGAVDERSFEQSTTTLCGVPASRFTQVVEWKHPAFLEKDRPSDDFDFIGYVFVHPGNPRRLIELTIKEKYQHDHALGLAQALDREMQSSLRLDMNALDAPMTIGPLGAAAP